MKSQWELKETRIDGTLTYMRKIKEGSKYGVEFKFTKEPINEN